MLFRSLAGRLLGAAVLSATASCTRPASPVVEGDRRQILLWGNGAEPQDLDPQTVTGVPEHHILTALLEGLVSEDPVDLHPVPGVAERWEVSPDGLVYTFHLRAGARWSNGDPVTAQDFVRSYQRMLTPSFAAQYAYMFYYVAGAEDFNQGRLADFSRVGFQAPDARTLQVTLRHPTPFLLSVMNHYSWFPVHLPTIEKFGGRSRGGTNWTRPGNFVGNGPFVLQEWRPGQVITVTRSPTYWDRARVRLQEIRFYAVESSDTEERMFRSGELHVTDTVPLSKIDTYRREQPAALHRDPYLGTYFYRLNITRPPLNDRRVRRALALAIDRESLIRNVLHGGQQPAYSLIPSIPTAGFVAQPWLHGNVAEARQLLAAAGYPGGQGFPAVELLYNTLEDNRILAEAIQQMWRRNLGIEVRLVNQEWKVYLDSERTMNYQIDRAGWIADYIHPQSFAELWVTNGGNNNTGFSNAEYDRVLAAIASMKTNEERNAAYQRLDQILMEEVPVIPLYFYVRSHLVTPEVKGYHPTLLDNHPWKYLYLER
ncbi:MAG: peptide ABC transporter substrate-binding protein [Opitutaceae bacterium]|nr:peptide ABC transporter substrate-binding protein [Opitutaceae bacterium]